MIFEAGLVEWSELLNLSNWLIYNFISIAAMKPTEVQEKLGLTRLRDRNWYVQPACATTGDGLYEGLSWLNSNNKSWPHK